MGRMGVLSEHDRVELLEGEVVVMSPIGNRHAACVSRLTDAIYASGGLGRRALVRVQIALDDLVFVARAARGDLQHEVRRLGLF